MLTKLRSFKLCFNQGSSKAEPTPTCNALRAVQVDIFSYGVMLWELATHEVAIRGQLRDVVVSRPRLRPLPSESSSFAGCQLPPTWDEANAAACGVSWNQEPAQD